MPEFTYEIVKTFGVISEGAGGWAKELNLISWNGKEPKYDIRDWGPDHEKMFEVEARLNSNVIGKGCARRKRAAAQQAAHEALILFGEG